MRDQIADHQEIGQKPALGNHCELAHQAPSAPPRGRRSGGGDLRGSARGARRTDPQARAVAGRSRPRPGARRGIGRRSLGRRPGDQPLPNRAPRSRERREPGRLRRRVDRGHQPALARGGQEARERRLVRIDERGQARSGRDAELARECASAHESGPVARAGSGHFDQHCELLARRDVRSARRARPVRGRSCLPTRGRVPRRAEVGIEPALGHEPRQAPVAAGALDGARARRTGRARRPGSARSPGRPRLLNERHRRIEIVAIGERECLMPASAAATSRAGGVVPRAQR